VLVCQRDQLCAVAGAEFGHCPADVGLGGGLGDGRSLAGAYRHHGWSGAGSAHRTWKPPSGCGPAVNCPDSARARSRMPLMPCPS
jgi:hypothetical protein